MCAVPGVSQVRVFCCDLPVTLSCSSTVNTSTSRSCTRSPPLSLAGHANRDNNTRTAIYIYRQYRCQNEEVVNCVSYDLGVKVVRLYTSNQTYAEYVLLLFFLTLCVATIVLSIMLFLQHRLIQKRWWQPPATNRANSRQIRERKRWADVCLVFSLKLFVRRNRVSFNCLFKGWMSGGIPPVTVTEGRSKQDSPGTQKPIYFNNFSKHIWSC